MPRPRRISSLALFPVTARAVKRETWLTPFGEEWERVVGGEPTWGQFANVLGRLKEKHGVEKVFEHFTNYLSGIDDAKFASLKRFSETFFQHAGRVATDPRADSHALERYREMKGTA